MPPRKPLLYAGRSRRESSGPVVDNAPFDKSAFIIQSVVDPEAGIRDDAPVQAGKTDPDFRAFTLQKKVDAQAEELALFRKELSELREQVEILSADSDTFKNSRRRFIATYRRDRLRVTLSSDDQKAVRSAGEVALEGWPRLDAVLYRDSLRSDAWVFEDLYGMSWPTVLQISNPEALKVLAAYATLKANGRVSSDLAAVFRKFVNIYQYAEFAAGESFLDDPDSQLSVVHSIFWNEYGKLTRPRD